MSMVLFLGILFVSGIQPVLMVVMLVIITFFYSLCIWNVMGSYWFSYMLMMVMLSGVLVVFTYMVSLIPNESFEMYGLVALFFFMVMLMKGIHMMYVSDKSFMSLNLWVSFLGMFNLYLVVYLLGVMLMVVWVSNLSEGAVRVM